MAVSVPLDKRMRIMNLGLARLARVLTKYIKTKVFVVGAKTGLARTEESTADETPAVFQPEVLLPLQFYETLRRSHLLEGEKLLMLAVLEDAVESYMRYLNSSTRKGQSRFREAEEWINHQDKLWLFSFDNVCEALDIDPDYMRSGLHQWKRSHLAPAERATVS